MGMQQPELGRKLTALRIAKAFTQEELVEKSNVSVRTIQRIEAGEVQPRMYTVKILLEALGESHELFLTTQTKVMETQKTSLPTTNRNTLLVAMIAGSIYLIAEIILGTLDIAWFADEGHWGFKMNTIYTGVTILMVIAFAFFARGFVALSTVFENTLLKVASYIMMVAVAGKAVLDVSTLSVPFDERVWLPYVAVSVIFGALGIVFGVAMIRLQDSMGVLARLAGFMEIIIGCFLITVVLFLFAYVFIIPTIVIEILLIYRGYEYLSRPEPLQQS